MGKFITDKNNSGQVLVLSLIFLFVMMIMAWALFTRTAGFVIFTQTSIGREKATHLSEAGIDYAIWQLNKTGADPTTLPIPLGNTGEFKINVTTAGSVKTITSIGCVPASVPGCSKPRYTRKIKVEVRQGGIPISFPYVWQTQTGSVQASYDHCGIDPSTNEIFGDVSIGGYINGKRCTIIHGDAWAGRNIFDTVVDGTKHENFSPVPPLPSIDLNYWQTEAEKGTIYSTNLTLDDAQTFGPAKINGSLTITDANKNRICGPITITGTIYITGELVISSCTVKLDESFGSNGTVVVAANSSHGLFGPIYKTSQNGYILFVTTNGDFHISGSGLQALFYASSQISNQIYIDPGVIEGALVSVGNINPNSTRPLDFHPPVNSNLLFVPTPTGGGGSSPWQIHRGTYRFAD